MIPDTPRERLEEVFVEAMRTALITVVNTAMPAVVVDYDPATFRAVVQPSPNDGVQDKDAAGRVVNTRSVPKPLLLDVPVGFYKGGGFRFYIPFRAGDEVLLVFSQRGIGRWKATPGQYDPPLGAIFRLEDAIAYPITVKPPEVVVSETGAVLQTEDGVTYLKVEMEPRAIEATVDEGMTKLEMAPGRISLNAGAVEIASTSLTHNGTEVGAGHRHTNVEPGTGQSGPVG